MKMDSLNLGMVGVIIFTTIFWFKVCHASEVDQTKVVVHHTDSHDVDAKTIDKWHKERGWDGIGYHYVVRKDGTIEEGRHHSKKGAHAKGRNNYIGIVLTGRDSFTQAQIDSLEKFLRTRKIRHVENHHRECPGDGINLRGICKKIGIAFAYHN
jgi:hypothetical protein